MQTLSTWLVLATTFGLVACTTGARLDPGPDPDPDPASETETETGEPTTTVGTAGDFIPDSGDVIDLPSCDPWAQDCQEGEKCVPYSSTGSGVWDSNKCVPVTGDGEVGDSCTYGGIAAATDSCGLDTHCWDVMDVDGMNIGVCTPFCTGTADDPLCGPDTSCLVANDGSINLCIATCDPLLQECASGLACFWANNDFNCIFTTDEAPEGSACGFINDCAPGSFCASADLLPECEGSDCCTGFCDLADPLCMVVGTECAPFFEEGLAAPGYEDVGVCIIPGS